MITHDLCPVTNSRKGEETVLESLRCGIFAALPQLSLAAGQLGDMTKNASYTLVVTDGAGARPVVWFMEGFAVATGQRIQPSIELPSSKGRKEKPGRPSIPPVETPELARRLVQHPSWPGAESLRSSDVLLLTNSIDMGGTIERMAGAVLLAAQSREAINAIDVLTVHMEGVLPLTTSESERASADGDNQRKLRLAQLSSSLPLVSGSVYCPPIMDWANPLENHALIGSRGTDVDLAGPKISTLTAEMLARDGISNATRMPLLTVGPQVITEAGVAAGRAYAANSPGDMLSAAEQAVVQALPMSQGMDIEASIAQARNDASSWRRTVTELAISM